jgi:hypothetical protein
MNTLTQHPAAWSNIVFIAPIIAAFYYGLNYLGAVGLLGIAVSSLYHYYREQKFYFADHAVSVILLLWGMWLIYKGGFEPKPIFYTLVAFVALAAYFFIAGHNNEKYEIRHSYWHLFISVVGILSILIFAL